MKTLGFGTTNRGRVRGQNEDCFSVDPEAGLYVVCDGLGGHLSGEVASRTAVDTVIARVAERSDMLAEARAADGGPFAVRVLVEEAINAASRDLFEFASTNPAHAGMATTLTLALLWNDSIVVGHVGDCRLYRLRDGKLQCLTSDHTIAAELMRRGQLAPEDLTKSPLANALTRTVGGQPAVLVDTFCLGVLPEDTYLACTDGLYRYFDNVELARYLTQCDAEDAPAMLTSVALERGGADNITAVVIHVPEDGVLANPARAAANQRRLEALHGVPCLEDLSQRHLSLVLEIMETQSYAAGELVRARGEPINGCFVLVEGSVEGLGSKRGDCTAQRHLTRADCAITEIRAKSNSEVLYLDSSALRRLVRRHPLLGTRIFWNLLTDE